MLVLLFAVQLPAQTPKDAQAAQHLQAGREAEKAGDYAKAAAEYRAVLKLKPESADTWASLGHDLYLMKNDEEAIPAFQLALKRKPDLPAASLFLGMAYLRTNQYAKAVPALKKAIALNPHELKAYISLSVADLEVGREEEAAAVLQKADTLFPNNTEVFYNLGKTYTKLMGKSYEQMAMDDPDSYRFHQVLGDSYEVRRDYPNAQAEYIKALEKAPNPYIPGLHYSLGTSYWLEGKWEPAVEEFKLELAITPSDALTTWKLGDTLLFERNYEEARPYLLQAIKEDPNLGQADRDMGKLLIQTAHPEEALPYLKKVVQLAPQEASVHFLLAQVYRKTGNTTELRAELETFQKLKREEASRSVKHPDTSNLGGVESSNERPEEEESLDDLK